MTKNRKMVFKYCTIIIHICYFRTFSFF